MTTWESQGAGWQTSEIGGVALEADRKWYFYPLDEAKRERFGPFQTMKKAIREAERMYPYQQISKSEG